LPMSGLCVIEFIRSLGIVRLWTFADSINGGTRRADAQFLAGAHKATPAC